MNIEVVKYMLMAQDMDRAVTFYRDVIGLDVLFESFHWSELLFGDVVVVLHGGGTGEFFETGLSFQVDDIEAACQEIAAGGGRILDGPSNLPGEPIRLADLVDPEGNSFMVTQYVN